ncbi:MAG: hypothetical protein HY825_04655 [Acidobacteria bacterium]|nr:hypothetical protein [Acidobacteriota bacterium]
MDTPRTVRRGISPMGPLWLVALSIPGMVMAAQPVLVTDVPGLYEAVNDPANVGRRIVLAPRTYDLSPDFENGGRLELQEGMELAGIPGDPAAVVIDASALPLASYQVGTFLTGPVRVGRGRNAVEWLTIRNDLYGAGLIETDLAPVSTSTVIRVEHVVLSGGQRGLDVRFLGPAFDGRLIEATFEGNELQAITRGMSQGIRITFSGVNGGVLRAMSRDNVFEGNQVGLIASSQAGSNNAISIRSQGDRFVDNRAGCLLIGGSGATASSNTLHFVAHGDEFRDNDHAQTNPAYTLGGGIVAVGGTSRASETVGRLEVFDSTFSGNGLGDIIAFGYYDAVNGLPVGADNLQELRVVPPGRGLSTLRVDSSPADAGSGNAVVVLPPGGLD